MSDLLDDQFHRKPTQPIRYRPVPLIVGLGIIGIGWLFFGLQWPGSGVLWLLGSAYITAYTGVAAVRFGFQPAINAAAIVVCALWLLVLIAGAFIFGGYPFNSTGLFVWIIIATILFTWQLLLGKEARQLRKLEKEKHQTV